MLRKNSPDIKEWTTLASILSCKLVSLEAVLELVGCFSTHSHSNLLKDLLSFSLTMFPMCCSNVQRACKTQTSKGLFESIQAQVCDLASLPPLFNSVCDLSEKKNQIKKLLNKAENSFTLVAFFDVVVQQCPLRVAQSLFTMFKPVFQSQKFAVTRRKLLKQMYLFNYSLNTMLSRDLLLFRDCNELRRELKKCDLKNEVVVNTLYESLCQESYKLKM
ncbi:hypothetical protein RCL1_009051 [Eukaryota sp. TZLM3-RCL]